MCNVRSKNLYSNLALLLISNLPIYLFMELSSVRQQSLYCLKASSGTETNLQIYIAPLKTNILHFQYQFSVRVKMYSSRNNSPSILD